MLMLIDHDSGDVGDHVLHLNHWKATTLRVLFSIVLFGQACNFITAVYITFAYLIKLRITSKLIISFYCLAYVVIIGYAIALVIFLKDPNKMFYDYSQPPRIDVATISKNIGNCAVNALGIVILVTMYQITVSIQLLHDEITVE